MSELSVYVTGVGGGLCYHSIMLVAAAAGGPAHRHGRLVEGLGPLQLQGRGVVAGGPARPRPPRHPRPRGARTSPRCRHRQVPEEGKRSRGEIITGMRQRVTH